ncbi:3-phenylpropionate/cinnamic acid dioxygenase subunit alpha [Rhodococcus fascians]|jgi:Rieske 2Fe-2S family protein|uniref:aromatic ring-hydroxylating oxygenase subunit alpha n=2 Tax=Nocardiaceae TaxID=85025 RepID=UPI001427B1A5|nr:3-phenylpropionate/cinnamic acid dioxygenase subunit alpha [Rhodococcus fascians]
MTTLDHGTYFTSLPREYYVSPEHFATELDEVWARQWVYVGHISQIPKRGDYFTFELANESILLIRDEGDTVNAVHNVCRHRALRLCDQPTGSVRKRLVCPYHSWSYALDGELKTATRQTDGENFNYSDFGLYKIHVDVWKGFIFICLADEAPKPVASMIDEKSSADMDLIGPTRLKVAHEIVYDAQANWKLLLENGVECYHCPSVHPEFCVVLNAEEMSDYYDRDMVPEVVQGLVIPVKAELDSLSMDGSFVSKKLLGEFDNGVEIPREFGAGFMTQPGYAWGGFHPDYGMVATTIPISATRTKMLCQWFVHEDAVEGVDYDVDELIKLWDVTNIQDLAIQERQQQGLSSSKYTPGPNSFDQEPGIRASLRLYLDMLGELDESER